MALYKIFSSRVNNIDADQYAGSVVEEGLIWYDPTSGTLRLYNGDPGGLIINGSGNVTNQLVNGTSNVVVYPNGNVAVSVNGTANVAVFSNPVANFGNIIATGNITANEFFGNGAGLTDVTAATVGVLPNLSVSGTVTAGALETTGNISAVGNIAGDYFVGNGALLTGIASNYGNANVAAYLPTYTGSLAGSSANITGNVTADLFVGNGAGLTNVTASNVGVLTELSVTGNTISGNLFAAGEVSVLGNITGTYILGNGAFLTGIAGEYGNANVAAYLPTYTGNLAGGNATVSGVIYTAALDTEDSSALIIQSPLLAQSSVVIDDSLTIGGNIAATQITAVGNVVGTYFIGNGSLLTGIAGGNSLPTQLGQAGKYLTTDGLTASWNDALAASLTFDGGSALANAAAELVGGTAANIQTNSIEGGAATSSYDLTLASIALTGQYEDLVDQDVSIPTTPTSAGSVGQVAFDTSWIYICVANNVWRRASLQTW